MYSQNDSEGLQHDPYSSLEVVTDRAEREKMLAVSHEGLEAVPPVFTDKLIRNQGQGGSRQTICGFGRKTVWVGAIIALAIVVIAAVVGGVVASRKPHRTNSSTSAASGDASPTPSSSSKQNQLVAQQHQHQVHPC